MRKRGLGIIITILLVMTIVGCSKEAEDTTTDSGARTNTTSSSQDMKSEETTEVAAEMEMMDQDAAPMEAGEGTGTKPKSGADLSSRKIIETRDIYMETEHFDTVNAQIEDLVFASLGYIEASNIQGKSFNNQDEYYKRYANYTLRIPAEYFKGFVDQLTKLGYVVNNNVNKQDVTTQFMDMEARIKAMEIQEERLLALLEKSAKLEDILELERELADVRYEIESYTSLLNNLDNRVRYSTVYLELQEVFEIVEKPDAPPKTFGEKISSGLSDTLEDIGNFFTNFAIWFIVNLPYILIWVVIIGGIVLFIRSKIRKLNKETEAKRQAALEAQKVEKNDNK